MRGVREDNSPGRIQSASNTKLSTKKCYWFPRRVLLCLLLLLYYTIIQVLTIVFTSKAREHEYIFSKYSRNLNISGIFWACYTKNNFPIIFSKYKKRHFLTSIEIWNFTFQIKPVWFEARNFLMGLKKFYWN